MKEVLQNKLQIIIARYEKLGLNTPQYQDLLKIVGDDEWLEEHAKVMAQIGNSERIFNVSKQINAQKNDVRLDEAFAEFDTGKNIATTNFYGTFSTVTYLAQEKDRRWPDFIAENNSGVTPIEVKLLTPQDLSETKFFQKFIDKINNDALPQLNSYFDSNKFEHGFIFIWSYQPIQLQNLNYHDLKDWLGSKVPKQRFRVTILCNFYGRGMWDFPI